MDIKVMRGKVLKKFDLNDDKAVGGFIAGAIVLWVIGYYL